MLKLCITVEDAAEMASVSDEQIREWAKDIDFPSMKIGRRGGKRLIHVDAFNEWLRKRCEMRVGE
ncbi:helix-turn-helix domain-containing protein [Veillonella caviae]|uniref:helix-turn-helix domain-containing protein n=1 Tax=Veillonella caviae TaxID=248316 RepID=UPI002A91312E|nr:helix-turn-helix domain-containing protein [Veillonella caviae]MDY5254008.1 helix-turn-helix domain-containing protein [Veillonella caviae]